MKRLAMQMTRRTPKKNVPRTSQIGALQNAILKWILTQEEKIEANGTENEKLVLAAKGVPWSTALFCKSYSRAYKADGYPDSSKISTSLKLLEEKKGLVKRHGKRTAYVKLTEVGRRQAEAKRVDARSWQEKRAVQKVRYLYGNISYELERYGYQMSDRQRYTELARQAFYLICLEELGQANAHEKFALANTLRQLDISVWQQQLPIILENPSLSPKHFEEIKALHEKLLERDVDIYAD